MKVKLSDVEIADIEETLEMNGVVYEDIKSELVDHIASEIEALLEQEDLCYEKAFKMAFANWKKDLQIHSDGIWVSKNVTAPKIIMDRWIAYSKRHFIYIIVISGLFTSLIALIRYDDSPLVLDYGIRLFCMLNLGLVLISRMLIWRYNTNTSVGYLFKRRSLMVFFMPLMISFGLFGLNILHGEMDIRYAMIFFLIALNIYFVLDYPLVLKHIRLNKKLAIS